VSAKLHFFSERLARGLDYSTMLERCIAEINVSRVGVLLEKDLSHDSLLLRSCMQLRK
jgi:hypothetical protein